MNIGSLFRPAVQSVAFIGNHLPRQCGIATFTTDLLTAVCREANHADCWAMAMNDIPEGYPYPKQVCFELDYKKLTDYRLATDFLNMNQVDVVCLQHEFGIYGGNFGSHVLELLRGLRMPVVTTLHTVLKEPMEGQRNIIEKIARYSDRIVVMSNKAREILLETYGIDEEKIVLIPHGIPDVPFVDPNFYKDQFGVQGRKVILTFGLLSPGKGIEYMIDALPRIIERYPDVTYMVLGATHPHIVRNEGEAYRHSLQLRAREKGVENHLIFHNRFVDLKQLIEFLGAADIYVTPYLNRDQVVSGTLAYALGAGKATISTPYEYAEEMLSDNRGRLVPFRDPAALATQIIDLLDNEVERHAMRKQAYTYSRTMVWKEVARRYLELFAEVKYQRELRPMVPFRTKTLQDPPLELPNLKLDHLRLLTDDVGILQHAKFTVPDRAHGYCTDDNARGLIAAMMAQDLITDAKSLYDLACCYLSFLHHAFNETNGRFRNFMGYDRRWIDDQGSEDCHGRAIWGLGVAVALSNSESLTGMALNLFELALPVMTEFKSPRACAFGLVGIHAYLRRFSGHSEVRRVRANLAHRLFELYVSQAKEDWPWIEDTLTYSNASIPQALLLSGQWLHKGKMIEAGLRSLEWMVQIQTDPKGHFVPIGNHGWYTRGKTRARFDQQPIEAQSMIDACREAFNITRDPKWIQAARTCFDWFMGRNDLSVPLYDYHTGGCCDGLTADGANLNQGAESTLSWLLSLITLYSLSNRESAAINSLEH